MSDSQEESFSEYSSSSSSSDGTSSDDGSVSDASTIAWDEGSEPDFENLSYNIAVQPVKNVPNLQGANDPWVLTTDETSDNNDFDFDEHAVTGIKHVIGCETPRNVFDLFFTSRLWDMIVTMTNKYARSNNVNGWKDVTRRTMYGFMSIVFNMGLIKKNQIYDYWSTRQSHATPWFRYMMPRNQFAHIFRAFRIVDNDSLPAKAHPDYRPSLRLRPLLDYIDVICMHYMDPGQNVAIDESLVAGKTRNPIRQYLPNKHHARWGTKVWLLADSATSYMLKCYIYEGARYDPTSKIGGQGYHVVVRLMEMANLYDYGHHLYTDNTFTSYQAASYLLSKQTYLTGTMR